jgi:hypothetical protein
MSDKCNQSRSIVQALPDIMGLVFFWTVTYYIHIDGFDKNGWAGGQSKK